MLKRLLVIFLLIETFNASAQNTLRIGTIDLRVNILLSQDQDSVYQIIELENISSKFIKISLDKRESFSIINYSNDTTVFQTYVGLAKPLTSPHKSKMIMQDLTAIGPNEKLKHRLSQKKEDPIGPLMFYLLHFDYLVLEDQGIKLRYNNYEKYYKEFGAYVSVCEF